MGYDGVFLYAPHEAVRLGVILDVVYNHFGPSGAMHREYAEAYFSSRYDNEWGDALNLDGPDSGPVRERFTANAACWIEEFHLDGLRLDAVRSIHDASGDHIVATVTRQARAAARGRSIVVIAENEAQQTHVLRPVRSGGYGVDGAWNDDFHHSAVVAMTGRAEAYYSDYGGKP